MIRKCPVCGKQFDVLYPELWRYREGNMWICTWKCLRTIRKETEEDMYAKTKKDGTPAKKSGPKPKEERPHPAGGGDWEKMEAPAAELKLDGAVRIETKEPEKVVVAEPEEEKKITAPVNYDGFEMIGVRSKETGFRYEYSQEYKMFHVTVGIDSLDLHISDWKRLLDELKRVMPILGVEL